jgi:biopolymer transport protein TolR
MNFGRLGARSAQEPMSQINVTPLVDVMLVLLVIFIVTAPFLGSSLQLDLPRAPAGTPAAQAGESVLLEIDRNERLVLNGQPVAFEQLSRRLTELAALGPEVQLQLRADQAVPYGRVVQVLGLANQAGIARIGFIADAPIQPPQR